MRCPPTCAASTWPKSAIILPYHETLRGLATVIVVALVVPACAPTDPGPQELRLRQVGQYSLAKDFHPTGAVLADDGAVLVWEKLKSTVTLLTPYGTRRSITSPRLGGIVGAAFGAADTLELIDVGDHATVRLSRGGRFISATPIVVGNDIDSAVRIGKAWFIGWRASDTTYGTARLSENGIVSDVQVSVVPSEARENTGAGVVLANLWGIPAYTWRRAPFTTRATGAVPAKILDPMAAFRQHVGRSANWAALAPVTFADGAVQTVADLTSDRRFVIVYSRDGAVLSATTLNAPLGFVAAAPTAHRILAARNVGSLELVIYEWSWSS